MGNYRHVNILSNLQITAAGTTTRDINLRDPVSRLSFKWNVQAAAAIEDMVGHPSETVKKVEIIDGSDVLTSLDGPELMAFNYYDRREVPFGYINQVTNTQSYFQTDVDFGRWLWDQELALDPKRHDNLQYKITYDKALMSANAQDMWVTVMADCFDQKTISPSGFLNREEHKTWTPAANTTEYITLPTDQKIRGILARGYASDKHVRYQIHDAKITEDHDKHVILDTDMRSYLSSKFGLWPMIREELIFEGDTTPNDMFVLPSYETGFHGHSTAAEDIFWSDRAGNFMEIDVETGGSRVEGETYGYVPLHCIWYEMGEHNDIGDWWGPEESDDLELQTTGHTSVGTSPAGYVCLEQVRRY
jgi:hypothetical protein